MRLRRSVVTLTALSTLVALSACGSRTNDDGLKAGIDDRKLKVGVLWPVSGPSAANTADFIAGVKTALKEYADSLDSAGVKVELVIEDDQATPNVSVSGFQKLSTRDQVHVVLGPLNSNNALAVLPLAERAGVPTIVTATAPSLASKGWRTFFRGTYPNRYQVGALVSYGVDEAGWKRILVIHQETEYGDDLRDNTISLAKEKGAEVIESISYAPGTTNFLAIATKAKQLNADGVIVAGLGGESASVIKQLLDAGIPAGKIGAYAGTDANVVNEVIPVAARRDLLLVTAFNIRAEELHTDAAKRFAQAYEEETGRTPELYAALGFVQAEMIFASAMKVPNISKETMLAELSKREPFDSLYGKISLAESNELILPVWVQKYDADGEPIPIYHYVPAK